MTTKRKVSEDRDWVDEGVPEVILSEVAERILVAFDSSDFSEIQGDKEGDEAMEFSQAYRSLIEAGLITRTSNPELITIRALTYVLTQRGEILARKMRKSKKEVEV